MQFDIPCFVDIHGRIALFLIEMEEEWIGGGVAGQKGGEVLGEGAKTGSGCIIN